MNLKLNFSFVYSLLILTMATTTTTTLIAASPADDAAACADNGDQTCTVFAPLGKPTEFVDSSEEGIQLAMRRWVPEQEEDDNNIKCVIIFMHGGAGFHSGYSDILGQAMKASGIAFIAYDQAGYGYSDPVDGIRQYFKSMDAAAEDFNKIYKDTQALYPGKKIFAMGESFGCMILMHQILKEQKAGKPENLADGYVFSGPVVKLLPEMLPPGPVIAIIKFLAKFFPKLSTPGTDFFSTFDLAFGDKRWAQAGRADPIIQEAAANPPRLGQVSSVLTSMGNINNSLEDFEVPFKIFVGENESRVDVGAVKKLAEVAKSKDKSIEIVPGAYHQLYQDLPEVTKSVCDGVKDWVLARS